jgi:hypothetical protein
MNFWYCAMFHPGGIRSFSVLSDENSLSQGTPSAQTPERRVLYSLRKAGERRVVRDQGRNFRVGDGEFMRVRAWTDARNGISLFKY